MGYPGRVGSGWPVIKSGRVTGQPVFASGQKKSGSGQVFFGSGQKILTRIAMSNWTPGEGVGAVAAKV